MLELLAIFLWNPKNRSKHLNFTANVAFVHIYVVANISYLYEHSYNSILTLPFMPFNRDEVREKMRNKYLSNPDYNFEKVNRASIACGPMVKWAIAQVSNLLIFFFVKKNVKIFGNYHSTKLVLGVNSVYLQEKKYVRIPRKRRSYLWPAMSSSRFFRTGC